MKLTIKRIEKAILEYDLDFLFQYFTHIDFIKYDSDNKAQCELNTFKYYNIKIFNKKDIKYFNIECNQGLIIYRYDSILLKIKIWLKNKEK